MRWNFCDCVCDAYGDHALVCSGGGEWTKRHNLLRNRAAFYASRASMCPEVEKPGIPPRPLIGARAENGSDPDTRGSGASRPADFIILRLGIKGPVALVLAVFSGLRTNMLARSASDPSAATSSYAATKLSRLATSHQCQDEGITFIPMFAPGRQVTRKTGRSECHNIGVFLHP